MMELVNSSSPSYNRPIHLSETELQIAVKEVFAEGEDSTMPTLAEKYIEIGRLKGREEGREEGEQIGLAKGEQKARQSEQKAKELAIKTIRQTLVIRFQTQLEQYDDLLNQLELPALEKLSDLVFSAETPTEFEAELSKLRPDKESPLSE